MGFILTLRKIFGMEEEKEKYDDDIFEIYQDKKDGWRWRRKAPNGKIVGGSTEPYVGKQHAIENAVRNGMKLPKDK